MSTRNCLSHEEISAFVQQGDINGEQLVHLENCGDCRNIVDKALEKELKPIRAYADLLADEERRGRPLLATLIALCLILFVAFTLLWFRIF